MSMLEKITKKKEMNITEYLNETLREKFDPSKAKSVIEIEKAINNGDFEITDEMEFDCNNLDDKECRDIEDAIVNYWDEGGIDWLRVERDGNKFKIVITKTEEEKYREKNQDKDKKEDDTDKLVDSLSVFDEDDDEPDDDPDWDDDSDTILMNDKSGESEKSEESEESEESDTGSDLKKLIEFEEYTEHSVSIDIFEKGNDSDSSIAKKSFDEVKRRIKMRRIKKQIAYLNYKIDHSSSPEEKRKLKENIDFIKVSSFDENGDAVIGRIAQRKRVAQLLRDGKIEADDIVSRDQMKKWKSEAKEHWEKPENKDDMKEYARESKKEIKKYIKEKNPDKYKRMEEREARKALNRKSDKEPDKGTEKKQDKESDKEPDKGTEKKQDKEDGDKEIEKEEEITDLEGKKIKVITHTGPKGGKYYWPKGSPKDDKHKVYIDHNNKAKTNECMTIKEYILESLKRKFDPSTAKSVVEIEKAIEMGDFIVTNDIEFQCNRLDDISCEDLEEAIKQYWDDGGIDWLKMDRKGNKFKIYSVGSK